MMRLPAYLEGLKAHASAWRETWKRRNEATRLALQADEIAFLPAHLELIETPVSPTARLTVRCLIALFCVALLWSVIGELDIVASAPGRTVASSRTKTIQSAETAVVRRVMVRDGDRVRAGDTLIELDDTGATAEWRQAEHAVSAARTAERRYTWLQACLHSGVLTEASPDEDSKARELATLDLAQYTTRLHALEALHAQRQNELATAAGQAKDLSESAVIAAKRATDTGKLVGPGYVSQHEHLIRQQEHIDARRNLDGQRTRMVELEAAVEAARQDVETHRATTRQQTRDHLREARENLAQFEQDMARTGQRKEQFTLRAPVDGTVQQLATHTAGGVVTPAQPLMSVVPDEDPLEVEATITNLDIGFVKPGQRATVKIESFPYTRYGFIEGTVETVSHDAAQDEKLGLVFPARIRLDRTTLSIDGEDVRLTPGMNVTVEAKTGTRRVIDYLLSPLEVHVTEAGRER
jgi:hemolysin D